MAVAQNNLSKAIFDSPYAEAAFDETVSEHTIDLTKFGQAILQSKRAPEKVGPACLPKCTVILSHMQYPAGSQIPLYMKHV